MNLDVKMTSGIQFICCGNVPIPKTARGISEYLANGAKQIFIVPAGHWCIHGRLGWLKGTLQLSELVSRYFEQEVLSVVFAQRHPGCPHFTHEGPWASGNLAKLASR